MKNEKTVVINEVYYRIPYEVEETLSTLGHENEKLKVLTADQQREIKWLLSKIKETVQ